MALGRSKIIVTQSVIEYLDELSLLLFHEKYFSFIESAEEYIDKIYDFIEQIPRYSPKKSPDFYKNKGSHYVAYKASKRTTWYIFFNSKDNRYIINHITNNHVGGQHIRSLKE